MKIKYIFSICNKTFSTKHQQKLLNFNFSSLSSWSYQIRCRWRRIVSQKASPWRTIITSYLEPQMHRSLFSAGRLSAADENVSCGGGVTVSDVSALLCSSRWRGGSAKNTAVLSLLVAAATSWRVVFWFSADDSFLLEAGRQEADENIDSVSFIWRLFTTKLSLSGVKTNMWWSGGSDIILMYSVRSSLASIIYFF